MHARCVFQVANAAAGSELFHGTTKQEGDRAQA